MPVFWGTHQSGQNTQRHLFGNNMHLVFHGTGKLHQGLDTTFSKLAGDTGRGDSRQKSYTSTEFLYQNLRALFSFLLKIVLVFVVSDFITEFLRYIDTFC